MGKHYSEDTLTLTRKLFPVSHEIHRQANQGVSTHASTIVKRAIDEVKEVLFDPTMMSAIPAGSANPLAARADALLRLYRRMTDEETSQ